MTHSSQGTTFIDPNDSGEMPRVLVYLQHTITDGRVDHGGRTVVSRRFQFVEVTQSGGLVTDPGAEPYLNYAPINDDVQGDGRKISIFSWADNGIDEAARSVGDG